MKQYLILAGIALAGSMVGVAVATIVATKTAAATTTVAATS